MVVRFDLTEKIDREKCKQFVWVPLARLKEVSGYKNSLHALLVQAGRYERVRDANAWSFVAEFELFEPPNKFTNFLEGDGATHRDVSVIDLLIIKIIILINS